MILRKLKHAPLTAGVSDVILSETKNLSLFFAREQIEERFFASLRMTTRNKSSAGCEACAT